MMAKFLIINSHNKKNIGIIKDYSDTFESPDVIKLTDEQVNEWNSISPMERTFRLNEHKATNDKKKIFQIVEGATKPVGKESVEMPKIEIEEPLNEPVNEIPNELKESLEVGENLTDKEYNDLKEEFKPLIETIEVKAKGRPKKVK